MTGILFGMNKLDLTFSLLIGLLLLLRVVSLYKNINLYQVFRTHNKPRNATECVYCEVQRNKIGTIKTITCLNPEGKDLGLISNSINCPSICNVFSKKMPSNIEKNIKKTNLFQHVFNEFTIFFFTLIPSLIALYKILEP